MIILEMAVDAAVGSLRRVTVSISGVWLSNRDTGIDALFSQGKFIPKPDDAHHYHRGYDMAASVAGYRSLADLHAALRRLAPKAKLEFDWGSVDALADELISRGESIRVF